MHLFELNILIPLKNLNKIFHLYLLNNISVKKISKKCMHSFILRKEK